MRSCVIAEGGLSNLSIDHGADFVTPADGLFRHRLMRADPLNRGIAAFHFGDDGVVILRVKPSPIADLSAGFSIERRVIEDDLASIAGLELLCALAIVDDGQHFAGGGASLTVAFEFRLWHLLVCGVYGCLGSPFPGSAGARPLLGHGAVETFLIELDALIACGVLHEVNRHAEGVVKPEGFLARINRLRSRSHRTPTCATDLTPKQLFQFIERCAWIRG